MRSRGVGWKAWIRSWYDCCKICRWGSCTSRRCRNFIQWLGGRIIVLYPICSITKIYNETIIGINGNIYFYDQCNEKKDKYKLKLPQKLLSFNTTISTITLSPMLWIYQIISFDSTNRFTQTQRKVWLCGQISQYKIVWFFSSTFHSYINSHSLFDISITIWWNNHDQMRRMKIIFEWLNVLDPNPVITVVEELALIWKERERKRNIVMK